MAVFVITKSDDCALYYTITNFFHVIIQRNVHSTKSGLSHNTNMPRPNIVTKANYCTTTLKSKPFFCVFCPSIGMRRNEIRSRGISRQTCLGIPGCFRTPLHKFLINEIPRLLMLGPLYRFQKTKANTL